MVVGSIPTVGAYLRGQQGKASAPLAQWIARWTSNPKVAGSSPAGGMALGGALWPRQGSQKNINGQQLGAVGSAWVS